jgi:predicted component of type VI protein secretion system
LIAGGEHTIEDGGALRLVIEDESGTRSVVPFATDEITVGRAPEGNSVRLTDRDVSRQHARFVQVNGAVYVEDLGSLTGTRLNGERISARRRIREGDLAEIGAYDLALLPDEGAADPDAPPPLPQPARPSEPTQPSPRPQPVPPTRRARTLRLAVLTGAIALVAGVLLGFAAGKLTAPAPAAPAARGP